MSMKRVFVAGHNGMVGSAICRKLKQDDSIEVITRGRYELDLADQSAVNNFFIENHVDEIYLAAARVGGISANHERPAEFIGQNLMIQTNVIDAAYRANVQKLLFLGSSCIYPKHSTQPICESELLKGPLEPTNEPYAIAKIAGIKMCESYNRQYGVDYRSVMPTNLYGPQDNFHPSESHVIPGLIRRFHEAKIRDHSTVTVWGSGRARREFLYVDEMADASLFVMNLSAEKYQEKASERLSHINIGSGIDYSIKEVVEMIASLVGFEGVVDWDTERPDGTPRKLMDSSKLESMGWSAKTSLENGLRATYEWFLDNQSIVRV